MSLKQVYAAALEAAHGEWKEWDAIPASTLQCMAPEVLSARAGRTWRRAYAAAENSLKTHGVAPQGLLDELADHAASQNTAWLGKLAAELDA